MRPPLFADGLPPPKLLLRREGDLKVTDFEDRLDELDDTRENYEGALLDLGVLFFLPFPSLLPLNFQALKIGFTRDGHFFV